MKMYFLIERVIRSSCSVTSKESRSTAQNRNTTYYFFSLLIDDTGVFHNTAEEVRQPNSFFSQVCFYKLTFGSHKSWF